METLIPLSLLLFGITITPGPNNLILLQSGIHHDWQRVFGNILGIQLGGLLVLSIVVIAATFLKDGLDIGHGFTRFLAVGCLLYIAWKIVGSSPKGENGKPATDLPQGAMALMVFQLLNPKSWVLVIAVQPYLFWQDHQYLPAPMSVLVFIFIPFLTQIIWSVAGMGLGKMFNDPIKLKWIDYSLAVLLVVMAIALTFE